MLFRWFLVISALSISSSYSHCKYEKNTGSVDSLAKLRILEVKSAKLKGW